MGMITFHRYIYIHLYTYRYIYIHLVPQGRGHPPRRHQHQVEDPRPPPLLQGKHQHLPPLSSRKVHLDVQARGSDHQRQGRILLGLPTQALSFAVISCQIFFLVRNF